MNERALSGWLIQVGKRILKGTPFERIPAVGAAYRLITRIGYGAKNECDFRGFHLKIDSQDQTMAPGLLNGTYEKDELDWIEKTLQPGWNFFDIGANIGLYTLVAKRRVGSKGRVVALEPNPNALEYFNSNLRDNSIEAEVLQVAAGSEEGVGALYQDPKALGSGSLSSFHGLNVPVKIRTLDSICQELQFSPKIVKIDIEGFEEPALRGFQKTLKEKQPLLMVEFNPALLKSQNKDPDSFLDFCRGIGRVSIIVRGGTLSLLPSQTRATSLQLVNLVIEPSS